VVVVPGRLVDVVGSVVVVDDVVVLDELVVVLEEGAVVVEFGTVVVVPGAVVVVAGPFDTGTTPQGPPEPDRCGTENGLPPGPVCELMRVAAASFPSGERATVNSMTIEERSPASFRDVRSVEKRSGSIENVATPV